MRSRTSRVTALLSHEASSEAANARSSTLGQEHHPEQSADRTSPNDVLLRTCQARLLTQVGFFLSTIGTFGSFDKPPKVRAWRRARSPQDHLGAAKQRHLPTFGIEPVADPTCLMRPMCSAMASVRITPLFAVPRKLLFSSTMVKPLASSGRCAAQA